MEHEIKQLSNSDYDAIVRNIRDHKPDYNRTFEVVCELQMISLWLNIEYEAEYQNCIGGSYEDYDFEMLSEVANEYYSVKDYQLCNADGDPIEVTINTIKLEKLLN